MSKEIAQTVGTSKIAWLLAIVAAFAVFAAVSMQFRTASADVTPASYQITGPYTGSNCATLSAANLAIGTTVWYCVSQTADDPTIVQPLEVVVTVPATLAITGFVPTSGPTPTCVIAGNLQSITCNYAGILPTSRFTLAVSATVLGDVGDNVVTATVNDPSAQLAQPVGFVDTNPINTVAGSAATKVNAPTTIPQAGGSYTSTITYTSPVGEGATTALTITDTITTAGLTIPAGNPTTGGTGTTFALGACSSSNPAGWPAAAIVTTTNTVLSCPVTTTTVTAGQTVSLTFTTNVPANPTLAARSICDTGAYTATVDGLAISGTSGPVCVTQTGAVLAELRHMSDIAGVAIPRRDIDWNVRNSRHTICAIVPNSGVIAGTNPATAVYTTQPTPAVLPGLTLANISVTNGGGYASTTDTDPTFTDVRIFIGDGTATGQIGSSTTAGLLGATCISWVSADAGDQQISIIYVDPVSGLNVSAHWDNDGNGNGLLPVLGPNTSIIKEWNRLEDSVIVLTGGATGTVTGTGPTGTITRTVTLTLNPITGLWTAVPVGITDAFRGSHTNAAGQKEGPFALAGVTWTAALATGSCGVLTGDLSGVTYLGAFGQVLGGPNLSFGVGNTALTNCGPGSTATINFTGSEPNPIGSGTGIVVTEQVIINFSAVVAQKQVFLAWAGQRIILEHDWRTPAGDVNNPATTARYPDPLGSCFGFFTNGQQIEAQRGYFDVRYIKGSGPGNFLPGLGAEIRGADQATVEVGTDSSQSIDANDHCISRVLFESEDQGQVDIEAFILNVESSVNVTKHAFVIYYMKLNTVTTSLVTQVSKPNHNSTSAPDWAPGNPWNSSLDDADGAASWNVSKDILARVRVTGWFLTTNPSGRPADTSNPLNILPANRWVMPDDWAQLHGGPIDVDGLNDTVHRIGTAEEFRSYYDLMIAPNNTSGQALGSPSGSTTVAVGVTVAGSGTGASAATAIRVASCVSLTPGTGTLWFGATNSGFNVVSCANGVLVISGALAAAPAAGTLISVLGVPFEGPYSLIDIPGLAAQGFGGAALSNFDPGNIRDTIWGDGDVDAWDAPMPPAMVSIRIRGTGFLKPVIKSDVYYIGTPNTASQVFPNPYYIQNIPDSPWIPAVVVGGGYLWNSWGNDGPGGNGDGVYTFWQWARTGTNSAGTSESLSAADLAELAIINAAGHGTVARDAVIYTDNHGEGMFAANGDFKTDLTACATNALAGGKHCKPGDKVGTGTITATADYPDFRGKHFPVLSNAVTVDWLWGGYKDVTVHPGETDQFKYIVFHAMDRDAFCGVPAGAISLHPVLTSADALNDFSSLGARYNFDPNENVDFLIDSGQGIIIGQSGGGTINDGRQFGTGVTTFSVAANNPAVSGILEFPLSPLAAEGQTDECQAWVKISNSLLGIVNVLTIAHDDEGNIGFDRVIDLSNTQSYTLNFRWSLITWAGADGISVTDAIKGTGTGGKNPGGNDISSSVTAIYGWNAPAQQWLGYFPSGVNVPGANDLTSLRTGDAYWIAITGPSSVTWTIATNIN